MASVILPRDAKDFSEHLHGCVIERRRSRGVACWTYRTATSDDAVEFGTVTGRDVAPPAHFHDEDQITFVLAGRRTFLLRERAGMDDGIETIEAGRGILIPAGSVHRSLSEPAGVIGINLYVSAGAYATAAMIEAAESVWRKTGLVEHGDLARIVRTHRLGLKSSTAKTAASNHSVAERARQLGLSREGFSRSFARRHGMPPHAFDLMSRLNHARRLLRQGERAAAAAFDAGFADQSHLGRCFRQAFGVTPGQYCQGQITNVPDATTNGS